MDTMPRRRVLERPGGNVKEMQAMTSTWYVNKDSCRAKRKELGVSQRTLGLMANVNATDICKFETGKLDLALMQKVRITTALDSIELHGVPDSIKELKKAESRRKWIEAPPAHRAMTCAACGEETEKEGSIHIKFGQLVRGESNQVYERKYADGIWLCPICGESMVETVRDFVSEVQR